LGLVNDSTSERLQKVETQAGLIGFLRSHAYKKSRPLILAPLFSCEERIALHFSSSCSFICAQVSAPKEEKEVRRVFKRGCCAFTRVYCEHIRGKHVDVDFSPALALRLALSSLPAMSIAAGRRFIVILFHALFSLAAHKLARS